MRGSKRFASEFMHDFQVEKLDGSVATVGAKIKPIAKKNGFEQLVDR